MNLILLQYHRVYSVLLCLMHIVDSLKEITMIIG
uniref:Uncharacterized protein n=1 Tax=virus sp. ctx9V1 TaxID=2828001 RepID=A0A8S5RCL8_9VIRU|nr:MAG TPA: hypothetical protein [virus sp. ctx9V1]